PEAASRRHARGLIAGNAASIEDLGSKNGTFLRGTRIAGPSAVRHDDEIRLGGVKLTLRLVPDDKSTKTEIAEPPSDESPRPGPPPASKSVRPRPRGARRASNKTRGVCPRPSRLGERFLSCQRPLPRKNSTSGSHWDPAGYRWR